MMKIIGSVLGSVLAMLACVGAASAAAQPRSPNVVFILADDVGYGDLGCYGATRVKTPNLDRLAKEGRRFTDAHAPSATCTPSRYALLTGQYAWRKQGTGILPGDANLIIPPGSNTLPAIFQNAGYKTGIVGKWHLGLGDSKINWNVEVKPGPREVGFGYSFIVPATGDRTPCVYMEDQKVVGLDSSDPIEVNYQNKVGSDPTGKQNPDLLKMKLTHGHDMTIVNGISRIGWMSGGKAARWVDEDMADVLAGKAVKFIEENKSSPFFLYFATHDVHVPRVPHKRFVGTSGCGTRGDAIHQLDWQVGQVMAALDRLGLAEDTLVIFSSDNGPVLDDGYADGAVKDLNGHTPAGVLRGGKYSLLEGGHRVPFIARWPGRIRAGGVSDALVAFVDMPATAAALVTRPLGKNDAPDSVNVLDAVIGEGKGREELVVHAGALAIRRGNLKLIPAAPANARPSNGKMPGKDQLYDVAADPGETANLAEQRPEKVKELSAALADAQRRGRTRPE
jgi:arylsulfatase A-like enzyme